MTNSAPTSGAKGAADLHIHTTYSDSALSPAEVVDRAIEVGLTHIAITDHDSMGGIAEATAAAQGKAVEVIPGVEISTRVGDQEIHILGLFVEAARGTLQGFLARLREERRSRIFEMAARLRVLGRAITAEEIFAVAGKGAPGRMHVAEALRRAGQVTSLQEAFYRYIGDDGPAYVQRHILTPAQAVEQIRSAGGVPILAHPGLSNCDELIPSLVQAGVMGMEVYYPGHSTAQEQFYLGIARKHNLLLSGGSDCHGCFKGDVVLGQVRVTADLVKRIREAALRLRS